ncbi:response regulator [Pedobacter sp.]|uniref:response regulator n=1 Tax=Pedobacter sp. TaxID=1411316 RepID=UPI003D7FC424
MLNQTKKPNRILLIDDSEIDLRINSKILSIHFSGSQVVTCLSAEEGLQYLKKSNQQQDQLPDLILLDIQMPEMDGFGFLEHYRSLPKSITEYCTIVFLSSTLDFGDIKRAEANLFVSRMLKKPLNPAELKEILS